MKITKRAEAILKRTDYRADNPAIMALVCFAAQNPGLEFGNYGNHKSYNEEMRGIGKQFTRFKAALAEAHALGVTDAMVIAEAPHAFSGRLTWSTDHWEYCAGQYYPTEYRAAAATLLESCCRIAKRNRPPAIKKVSTIAELKALNEENGGSWFSKGNTAFFRTRIESGILKGRYFVTSEQYSDDAARMFTLRSFDEKGDIDTVGKFNEAKTKAAAMAQMPEEEVAK